jgi:hypothetical protein
MKMKDFSLQLIFDNCSRTFRLIIAREKPSSFIGPTRSLQKETASGYDLFEHNGIKNTP